MSKIVILDNIRSAHNVGSIFRSSDGAGVERIYLFGYTPAPIDRFGRQQEEIKKTSLGATDTVSWEQVGKDDERELIIRLQFAGYSVVAVEQSAEAIDLYDFTVPEKVVYILGAEVEGVRPELMAHADQVVEIPMKGAKESLNVSVAAGIVLFHR